MVILVRHAEACILSCPITYKLVGSHTHTHSIHCFLLFPGGGRSTKINSTSGRRTVSYRFLGFPGPPGESPLDSPTQLTQLAQHGAWIYTVGRDGNRAYQLLMPNCLDLHGGDGWYLGLRARVL